MKYNFSGCVLDDVAHSLSRNCKAVRIEPQVFDLLLLLLKNAGTLMTKDRLIEEIWGGRIVSESAISARIAAARKAVGDDGKRQIIIRTVARRGVQFVAEIDVDAAGLATAEPIGRANSRPTIRYARTTDGASIAYNSVGSGPPLIRSHQFPSHLEQERLEPTFQAAVDALSEHLTVVRYDQRGGGLSDWDLPEFNLEVVTDEIIAVADAAGLERFALMGVSSGARNAVSAAVSYPERVSHLILQSGYVDGRSMRGSPAEPIVSMIQEGWDQKNRAFIVAFLSMYFPSTPADWVSSVAEALQTWTSAEIAALVRTFNNESTVADLLPRVKAPTLILHCRDDAVHPVSEARKMAAGIANSELVVIDSPNHWVLPHEKDWAFHLECILEFLALHSINQDA